MFKDDSIIRQEIKRLRKLSKKFPLLFARIGECYIDLGNLDAAEKVLLDGLRRHPGYITGYLLAGECYLYRGQIRDAEEMALKGLQKAPSHLGLLDLMRRIKKQAEEFEDLEKVNRSIRVLDPLRTGIGVSAVEASVAGQREQAAAVEEIPVISEAKSAATGAETPFNVPSPGREEDPLEKALEAIAAKDASDKSEMERQDAPASIEPSEPVREETVEELGPQEIVEKQESDAVSQPERPAVTASQEPSEEIKAGEELQSRPETVTESPQEPLAAEPEPLGEKVEPEQTSPVSAESEGEKEIPLTVPDADSGASPSIEPAPDQEPEVIEKAEVPLTKPASSEPEVPTQPELQTTAAVSAENPPTQAEAPADDTVSTEEPEAVSQELKSTADEGEIPLNSVPSGSETVPPPKALSLEMDGEFTGDDKTESAEDNAVSDEPTVEATDETSSTDEVEEASPNKTKTGGRIKKRLKELSKLFAEEEGKDAFGLPLNFEEQSMLGDAAQKSGDFKPAAADEQKETRESVPSEATGDDKFGGESPKPKKPKIATKTLGELYATQKKYDEAIEIYEKLIENDPTNEAYIQRLTELKRRRAEALG